MDMTSSSIAVATLAFQVLQYVRAVEDGGKERDEVEQELKTISRMMEHLRDLSTRPDAAETPSIAAVQSLSQPNGDLDQLKQVLEQIYSKISVPEKRTKAILHKWRWPFATADVHRILGRLRSIQGSITIALGHANVGVSVEISQAVDVLRRGHDKEDLKSIVRHISPLDFRAAAVASHRESLEGTGEWFLSHPQVQGWCHKRTKVLWCPGAAGAGKTVLATSLFTTLCSRLEAGNSAVLILYCSFDDPKTHSVSLLMSALLRQLVERRGAVSEEIRGLYDGGSQVPEPDLIRHALLTELKLLDTVFVLVDGLDELPNNSTRDDLLGMIQSLQPIPQLFVTSRPLPALDVWFRQTSQADNGYRLQNFTGCRDDVWFDCDECRYRHRTRMRQSEDKPRDETHDKSGSKYQSRAHELGDGAQDIDQVDIRRDIQQDIDHDELEATYECKNCDWRLCNECYDDASICPDCSMAQDQILWRSGQLTIVAQDDDLGLYINWRLERSDNLQALLQNESAEETSLKEKIVMSVKRGSDGIFLLGKYHMDALEEQPDPRELINTLAKLSSNFHEIYGAILKRMGAKHHASMLRKFLVLVATAYEPLSVHALAHAMAVQREDKEVDRLKLPNIKFLASSCGGFVTVGSDGFVRLTHETIREWLIATDAENIASGHVLLAEICLSYLLLDDVGRNEESPLDRATEIDRLAPRYPFLRYAALYWALHSGPLSESKASEKSKTMIDQLVVDLLRKPAHVATVAHIMWQDDLETGSGWDAHYSVQGLHLAAYFGLTATVASLLAWGAEVDAVDSLETTPLMYAIQARSVETVRLLLHAKANPARRCQRGRTVCFRAVEHPYDLDIIRQLTTLRQDILINEVCTSRAGWKIPAIFEATMTGDAEVVRLFLSRKDLDARAQPGQIFQITALHRAVLENHDSIVDIFLEDERFSIDVRGFLHFTPLMHAAREGYPSMVENLLQRGADPNAQDADGSCCMVKAASDGSGREEDKLKCVQLLHEHGADHRIKDQVGWGILHAVAWYNHCVIARWLLSEFMDLDPNLQGHTKATPLHLAVDCQSADMARILIEFGARTDIKDDLDRTPLQEAHRGGHSELIEVLTAAANRESQERPLCHIADSSSTASASPIKPNSEDSPPFIYMLEDLSKHDLEKYLEKLGDRQAGALIKGVSLASFRSDRIGVDALEVLLDYGADINGTSLYGSSALHIAVRAGRYDVVKLLIERGCDIELGDENDWRPLTFVTKDCYEIGYLLTKHGAVIDFEDGKRFGPVLDYAVQQGDLATVRRLIEAGAPVQGSNWAMRYTPYQRAKDHGFTEIAEYLWGQAMSLNKVQSSSFSRGRDRTSRTVPDVALLPDLGKCEDDNGCRIEDSEKKIPRHEGKSDSGKLPTETAEARHNGEAPEGQCAQSRDAHLQKTMLTKVNQALQGLKNDNMTGRELLLLGIIGLLLGALAIR